MAMAGVRGITSPGQPLIGRPGGSPRAPADRRDRSPLSACPPPGSAICAAQSPRGDMARARPLRPLRMDDRLALPARPAGRGRRVGDDLDQPRRHHAGRLRADRHAGRPLRFPGRVRRHDPRRQRPCHGLHRARGDATRPVDPRDPRLRRDADRLARGPRRDPRGPADQGPGHGNPQGRNTGVEVFGIAPEDLARHPAHRRPRESPGRHRPTSTEGIAIGSGVARELGVGLGDRIR